MSFDQDVFGPDSSPDVPKDATTPKMDEKVSQLGLQDARSKKIEPGLLKWKNPLPPKMQASVRGCMGSWSRRGVEISYTKLWANY